MASTIVGDVIDVEFTDDSTATEPTWTIIGRTRGELSYDSNISIAEDEEEHGTLQTDKAAYSEAWTMEFSNKLVSSLGALEVLGLLRNGTIAGFTDLAPDGSEGLRVTVYEDQAAKDAGEVKLQLSTSDALIAFDSMTITKSDYSTGEFTVHSRERFTVETSEN